MFCLNVSGIIQGSSAANPILPETMHFSALYGNSPNKLINSVVFPEPEGPITMTSPLSLISKLTPINVNALEFSAQESSFSLLERPLPRKN